MSMYKAISFFVFIIKFWNYMASTLAIFKGFVLFYFVLTCLVFFILIYLVLYTLVYVCVRVCKQKLWIQALQKASTKLRKERLFYAQTRDTFRVHTD